MHIVTRLVDVRSELSLYTREGKAAGRVALPGIGTGTGAAPYMGGKFTTNSATGTVWVENLATSLGLPITPAEVGFAGQSVKCPAAAQGLASTCTGYAQGGARVTDPDGVRHSGGALTVPLKTQIANHLAAFGSFKSTDGPLDNTELFVVPPGHYFMMGDNRDGSFDSRGWGFVPDANIVGKAFFIWFNFNDLKRIGSFH